MPATDSRSGTEAGILPRAIIELDAEALRSNFRVVREAVSGLPLLPMVKADAYGHGALWAAGELLGCSGLDGFGVATLEEGRELREGLGSPGREKRIVVFSGALGIPGGWNEQTGAFCERHALTPVLATEEAWQAFLAGGWPERLPYELEFNTGMNRLGIPLSELGRVTTVLDTWVSRHGTAVLPRGVFTHLASAEDPSCPLTRGQREGFGELRSAFARFAPMTRVHLANSAAIWRSEDYGLVLSTGLVRPGIALYGVPPWKGAPPRGLRPVLRASARVLSRYSLRAGDRVGYGGTFVASGPCEIAVLGAGYADGIPRSLKGVGGDTGGVVWLSGKRERFLGVISMDLAAVSCSPETRPGDWAEWLGPRIDPWEQAERAGSVPYELLTGIASEPRLVRQTRGGI